MAGVVGLGKPELAEGIIQVGGIALSRRKATVSSSQPSR